jgi:hypothetical protein
VTATLLNPEREPAVVPRWVIAAMGCFAAVAVLCAETLATSVVPTHAVIWGSLALASYIAGLLFLVGAADANGLGLSRWKFGPWMLAWYIPAFGLATLTWSEPQTSAAAEIAVSSVLRALWLVAVGVTCLAIGYAIGLGHPVRRLAVRGVEALRGRFGDTVRSRLTPWVLYTIGIAARIASTATTGRFGYVGDASSAVSAATGYGQYLSDLSLLAPLGVCAAALQVFRERLPGARLSLAVLFLSELAFGAAAGGKESFVIAILALVIPMSAARRRLPKVVVLACFVAFLVIVIPFNQAYRSAARGGSVTLSPSQAISAAPGILRQTLTGQSVIKVLPDSVIYLMQRVREIDNPAIVMQRTPGQVPYDSPVQLIEAPVADMVPRAVWAGKPILATGYQFSQKYFGLPPSVYTSSAITPIGDLYRHGGWVPVIAGMLVLGCGVRLLDDVLDVRSNPHAVFLVLLFFPSFVKGEQDWVTLLASIPSAMLVWLLAIALTFQRRGLR